MIITVASLKGGVGKSTVTQNLAVTLSYMGNSVAIVDTDANESCKYWAVDRDEQEKELPYIFVSTVSDDKQLNSTLKGLVGKYDVIIIDGTPSLNETTSRIIMACDLLLIPLKPGAMDIRATQKFLGRYQQTVEMKGKDIPAYIFINQYREGTNVGAKTLNLLEESELNILDSKLGLRTAFSDANEMGLGVYEYNDKRAKKEFVTLTNEVKVILDKL